MIKKEKTIKQETKEVSTLFVCNKKILIILQYQINYIIGGMENRVLRRLGDKISWFPPHMRRAVGVMQQNIYKADVILQVRDARIPYCSRNADLDKIIKLAQKQKIIILNKYDLCDPLRTDRIIKDYNDYGVPCMAISTTKHDDMRRVLATLKDRYQRKYSQVGLWIMLCGTPNVGKSSIINQIRNISDIENKSAAAKASASLCTTRGISGFKILQNPLMFLIDNPGMMMPGVITNELGMKMALLGMIKNQMIDKMLLVQYLVEELKRQKQHQFWQAFRVPEPRDAVDLLDQVRSKHRIHDNDAALDRILTYFREGKMGRITLDDPVIV